MDVKTTVLIEETVTYLVEVTTGQGNGDRAIKLARRAVSKGEVQPESREITLAKIVKREGDVKAARAALAGVGEL